VALTFGAAFWIQRTGWPELREAALAAEAASFDDLWIDDHLLADEGDWHDPKLEGWATLAAIAALTSRVRLGLLVAANTFRNPGLSAKLVTTLDHISDGRAILGMGAGWFEREHEAFGIEFGSSVGERLDWLAEDLPLIRRLLDGEAVTHTGSRDRMRDAIWRPLPIQSHVPFLIGGKGRSKTLPLIARHADLWNTYGTPSLMGELGAVLDAACADIGREPREISRSVYLNACLRNNAAEAERAWAGTRAIHRPEAGEDRTDLIGTIADAAATLREFQLARVDHVVLVFRSPFDLETIGRLPELRAALELEAAAPGEAPGHPTEVKSAAF
jgi:alkanesulfonate monooxygenase SsuD/methylene tetrahydromethanopterin reductase-like flavin-dependent oxidoreductase (luciferase family)